MLRPPPHQFQLPTFFRCMKLKSTIATSENGFLFNPATGDSFAANRVAADMLALLKEGKDAAAIQATMLERYEVAPGQLAADWDDLVAQLREHRLLD